MARALKQIYQLKIGLRGTKPPIWRRMLIVDSVPLHELHEAIQIVMGWTGSHLHQFIADGDYFGTPDPNFGFDEMLDESRYRLSQLLAREKGSIVYEYDFGDSWEHKVTLEKILPFDPKATLPRCVKGKGACPPEDVGGVWGYYNLLEALGDANHPEHDELEDWIGGEFDPDRFDIDAINARLARHFGSAANMSAAPYPEQD